MRSFVLACAAICGISMGVWLSHISIIIYIKKESPVLNIRPTPLITQLTGSIVAIDIPHNRITLEIMSPYAASESYRATLAYDETTSFRVVDEYAVLGTAGISSGKFPVGSRVQATVKRTPGELHMSSLFSSMAL